MELHRCRFCGEVYYGKKPSHCPFCGAQEKFLISIDHWQEENVGVELSETSKEALKKAQELEFYNTRFYRAAAQSQNPHIHGYFKYLSRVEGEHYSVICKLLGEPKNPEISGKENTKGSDEANLHHSEERETLASELYKKFASVVPERRIKEIFTELTEIESDHLRLDKEEINKLTSGLTA